MNRPPRLDLNPSSAERWTTCTASPAFILENHDKLPPSGSRFSEEGTTAHAVAAALLQDQPEPKDTPTPIDSDMRWHGWNYSEYVQSLRAPQSMLLVEQKLELWYMAGRHAIVDAAVINPLSLHVVDYKYGEGIVVHPENNLQAVIYAYSAGKGHGLSDDFPVFIHIYQPRGRNATEPAHVWETTWKEIAAIAVWTIQAMAEMILGREAAKLVAFLPSEKACQWCPAKGFCLARQTALLEGLTVIEDAKPHLPAINVLTEQQRILVERHGDEIIKWVKDVQSFNLESMKSGKCLPGFKLVNGRSGDRYWSDPKKAAELLLGETHLRREEVIEESVISPAGAEKLLGKRAFGPALVNLISRNPGKITIAPESDKREAVMLKAESEFEVIEDENKT